VKTPAVLNAVDFSARDGWFNMALDTHLFSVCEAGAEEAYLRFYAWQPPALSLGFHEPSRVIDTEAAARDGVDIVRRPTGGRAVLHRNDLTYAVVLPFALAGGGAHNVTDLYRRISECIVEGLRPLGADLSIDRGRIRGGAGGPRPCFASASRYEITYRGRKVVGSAQRVGRRCLLQHGSIPVGTDYLEIAKYLQGVDRSSLRERVKESATCLQDIAGGRVNGREIVEHMRAAFARGLNLLLVRVEADIYAEEAARLRESLRRGECPVTYDDKIT
jgi:lipoate-protein ligase A